MVMKEERNTLKDKTGLLRIMDLCFAALRLPGLALYSGKRV
jgi:hypothetical protein